MLTIAGGILIAAGVIVAVPLVLLFVYMLFKMDESPKKSDSPSPPYKFKKRDVVIPACVAVAGVLYLAIASNLLP
jgi:heme/copper-type cytochrome/quinol oxidase subunit 2